MVKLAAIGNQKCASSTRIRDLLKQSEIRITELAKYFHVSRTTLYQDLRSYDKGQTCDIRHDILCLFNYLKDNPGIAKAQVFGHALSNPRPTSVIRESGRHTAKEKEIFVCNVLTNLVDIVNTLDIDDIAEIAKILARKLHSSRASSL